MMSAKMRPAAERAGQEVLLVNRRQHLSRAALKRPVRNSWHPERALLRLAGLGDVNAPHCRRAISLAVNGLEHRLYPFSKALFRRLHRLTIHPGGRALRNPQQIPLHPFARDVMGKRRKAEFRLTPSFRCYMFKSRFHGQLIFPLHERPCLPLNGAHVAQKHFNYR